MRYWGDENYRVTIESCGKKTVLSYLKLETGEKRIFFFKSAVSVRDNDGKSFEQFQKIVEFLKKFSHKPTSR